MRQSEDELFKNILIQSRMEMPYSDFEDETMSLIKKEQALVEVKKKDRTLSWIFSVISIILGTCLLFVMNQIPINLPGISHQSAKFIFQLLFVVIFLLQIDSLKNYSFRDKKRAS